MDGHRQSLAHLLCKLMKLESSEISKILICDRSDNVDITTPSSYTMRCKDLSRRDGSGMVLRKHILQQIIQEHASMKALCKPQLQCLRTCRQMYIEACPILWSTNAFSFDECVVFRDFMTGLSVGQKLSIRDIRCQMVIHMEIITLAAAHVNSSFSRKSCASGFVVWE